MYKYKNLVLFFGVIIFLLLLVFFPISFDNNDDHSMYFISSGFLSGAPLPNILLTNIIVGKALNYLFSLHFKINWYTLYLQLALMLSLLAICFVFTGNKKSSFTDSFVIIFIILLGFATLCIVKLQFTTVSLFCALSALFCFQSDIAPVKKWMLTFLLIMISILIRREGFYVFILFSIPVLLTKFSEKKMITPYICLVSFSFIFFSGADYINNNDAAYRKYNSYAYLNALDIVSAKPIKYDDGILQKNNFTEYDIQLLQSWFASDQAYVSENIVNLARTVKSHRNLHGVLMEIKKFVLDERYVLLMYVFSIIAILVFVRRGYFVVFLNLAATLTLFGYLCEASRLPHRVTFPVVTYLIMLNLYMFIERQDNPRIKTRILSAFLLISIFKFYCVSRLFNINKHNHEIFDQCQQEINAHPDDLFIAIYDGLPLQYMNAWKIKKDGFSVNNILLAGWAAYGPPYNELLLQHQLTNLTSDLKDKKNVLFLTDSKVFQDAYVKVMEQRYQLNCHFEKAENGFTSLHPKVLIFDQASTDR